jgi:hypothetical protein
MLRFIAIGLCTATALASIAAIAQTDQPAVPSATGASQAVKQSVESPFNQLKTKGNLAKQKAGGTAAHARKNLEHARKMTTNPVEALKPKLNNVTDPLKPQ